MWPLSTKLTSEPKSSYPSPPMSRRSSGKDDEPDGNQRSASVSAGSATASTFALTPVSSQQHPSPEQHHPTHPPSANPPSQPQGQGFMLQAIAESPQQELKVEPYKPLSAPPLLNPPPTGHTQSNHPHLPFQNPYVSPQAGFQPSKPARQSKQHVQSACQNCKDAHLSCDDQRPCQRCVRKDIVSTCIDVPHRKRGRPRIREQIPNEAPPFALDRRRRSLTSLPAQQHSESAQAISPASKKPVSGFLNPPMPSPTGSEAESNVAVAYLDTDFRIASANNAFRAMFGFVGDFPGKQLDHLVDPAATGSLNQLVKVRSEQLLERDQKDPYFLPPIRNANDPGNSEIPQVELQDLPNITQGYTTHRVTLQLRTIGRSRTVSVELSLARTAVIFVVLKVPALQSPQRPTSSHQSAPAVSHPTLANLAPRRLSIDAFAQSRPESQPASPFHLSSGQVSPGPSRGGVLSNFPPQLSPISPISPHPYDYIPSFPSNQYFPPRSTYSSPYDIPPQSQLTYSNPPHPPPTSVPETNAPIRSMWASASAPPGWPTAQSATAPPPAVAPHQPHASQAEDVRLPPITTLDQPTPFHTPGRASGATGTSLDQARQHSVHEQRAHQRSADRERREGSVRNDERDEEMQGDRKRKRGFHVP